LINATNNNPGGYSEKQVQAIFIDTSDSYPLCSLTQTCSDANGNPNPAGVPDAYQSEIYLGRILRYLKCSTTNPDAGGCNTGNPRYPNLQQVFLSSRTYGLYANQHKTEGHWCLMPEPYAFEEGIGVQRIVVDQIEQVGGISQGDSYGGPLDYTVAPWFDWGPYLWVNGPTPRSDLLVWCSKQQSGPCAGQNDVRYGALDDPTTYWGDYTHPTNNSETKVAGQLVKWLQGGTGLGIQSYISDWVTWMKP
jgi:hypothetical protein